MAMGIRRQRTVAALCGGAAVLAVAVGGIGAIGEPQTGAMAPSSVVVPAPPSPGDTSGGGALPVKPAGGGGCILGLNCGPIHPNPPPPPRRHPTVPHDPQHAAPAPQNP
jgi:hypothetical protein